MDLLLLLLTPNRRRCAYEVYFVFVVLSSLPSLLVLSSLIFALSIKLNHFYDLILIGNHGRPVIIIMFM